MLKLVISDDEGKQTVVPLVREEISIGRREGNTIRLTERNVSRAHARLFRRNGAFVVEDLHSYNGVRVNGQRVVDEHPLNAGDRIEIGDYQLALHVDVAEMPADELAQTPAGGPAEAAAPPARLVMLTPPAPGAEFALTQDLVRIGRAEDLDVWVNHRSISREHAEVHREGDGRLRLIDLGSANGVRVNQEDVENAVLSSGDVIELGQVRFRFVEAGEPYRFDIARTIQLDAASRPDRRRRVPMLLALAILALVATGAAMVAAFGIGGGGAEVIATPSASEPRPAVVPSASVATDGVAPARPDPDPLPAPARADPVRDVASERVAAELFRSALAGCRAAVDQQRPAQALERANEALLLVPDDLEAQACQREAEALEIEEGVYRRALDAFENDELREAYETLHELPDDSPYLDLEGARRIAERYARGLLDRAREAVDDAPEETRSLARSVRAMPDATQFQHGEAEDLLRRVAAVAGASSERAQGSRRREPVAASDPPPADEPPEQVAAARLARVRDCSARGDNSCVIAILDGSAQSAYELDLLIEAYRANSQMTRAVEVMRRYVDRYPNSSRARQYRQIIDRYR